MSKQLENEIIEHFFQTTPHDRIDLKKAYTSFGPDLIGKFLNLISGLGLNLEFALGQLELFIEAHDVPKNWIFIEEKEAYFSVFENWLNSRFLKN
ncbi:hypothetical protein [Algoriphagus formosus]|uniref:hypothetical protein n=1 Tax=Algoriphagus formosus TaxID=2007308 RepID=UPI000C292AF1|nr:hypothetical protein [Algoriphagus formosus]